MAITYDFISDTTLSSAANSVEFTNIDQSYTDLVFVINASTNNENSCDFYFGNNSYITSATYNFINMYSRITSNTSFAGFNTNSTSGPIAYNTNMPNNSDYNNNFSCIIHTLPNYANTNIVKVWQTQVNTVSNTPYTGIEIVNGYNTTTSAINQVKFQMRSTVQFVVGSSFTLYGILKG